MHPKFDPIRVQTNETSNPDHDSKFHVSKMLVLTTQPSETILLPSKSQLEHLETCIPKYFLKTTLIFFHSMPLCMHTFKLSTYTIRVSVALNEADVCLYNGTLVTYPVAGALFVSIDGTIAE